MTKTDDSQVEKIANIPIPAFFLYQFRHFPASRGVSRRGKNERRQRPLPAPDALFDEAADQISDRNLSVFKTGSVYCVRRVPHESIVFVFCFCACSC